MIAVYKSKNPTKVHIFTICTRQSFRLVDHRINSMNLYFQLFQFTEAGLNRDEFREFILGPVCAWGECYRSKS